MGRIPKLVRAPRLAPWASKWVNGYSSSASKQTGGSPVVMVTNPWCVNPSESSK